MWWSLSMAKLLLFSTLEIHLLFFMDEFREGTYPPSWGVAPWKKFFLLIMGEIRI